MHGCMSEGEGRSLLPCIEFPKGRQEKVAKVSETVLQAVQAALQAYEEEVMASTMTLNSKHTYIHRAQLFVRCMDDDFEPGARVSRRR